MEPTPLTVTSRDGTTIAYDKVGQGPAVIVVAGALCTRTSWPGPELANLLAPRFTVYNYDRRGRGDSGDTQPYAVEREIEDIEALIDMAGGSACLFGISSGASLALAAAAQLRAKVKKLAMYEAPYNDDPAAQQAWREYLKNLAEALAAGRRGDAVVLFMRYTGMPAEHADKVRQMPDWPAFEALAPTLAYDHAAILGPTAAVPTDLAARVTVPTLIMSGSASYPFMHDTAQALARAIPNAELRSLEGQTHMVETRALAPVLMEFFDSESPRPA